MAQHVTGRRLGPAFAHHYIGQRQSGVQCAATTAITKVEVIAFARINTVVIVVIMVHMLTHPTKRC